MAEVTLSTTVDLTLVKMKHRETYVSEGLNRKIVPSQPPGIYQGLKMIQNLGTPRQVELSPDADTGFHMAVYQSTTGFSLTYWDIAGTAIILDLSDAALDSTDVVIAMEMNYTVGVDTTAVWIAFPLTDFNALPASRRDELVVLGTVAVPAPATNITTSMISFERTTMSWRNLSKGALSWSPIVRNGDFEQAEAGTDNILWWRLTASPGTGTGTLTTETGDPARGAKALTFANLTDGTAVYSATQNVAIPIASGQLAMLRFKKKNLVVSGVGIVRVSIHFADGDNTDSGSVWADIDTSAIDASYVEVVKIFTLPGDTTIRQITVGGTPDYSGSPADVLRIDDVQVWLETSGERNDLQHGTSGQMEVMGRLGIRDPDALYSEISAQMDYEFSGNSLLIRDRDNTAGFTLNVTGAVSASTSLGAGSTVSAGTSVNAGSLLGGSIANADVARIITPASVFAGVEYTLIWSSIPSGQNGARRYVDPNGIILDTVNAVWDNTTNLWAKDINGEPAVRTIIDPTIANGVKMESQEAGTNSWADGAWTSTIFETNPLKEIWISAMAGWGGPQDIAGADYVDESTGSNLGLWTSVTTGGSKWVTIPFPLIKGDRLISVTVYGLAGNTAGEELQGKIIGMSFTGSATQVSTTKTSATLALNIGWTTADTDLTPDGFTLLGQMYGVVMRIPQTSVAGEFKIYGVKVEYDHPVV